MVEIFTGHAIFPGDGGEISQLEKNLCRAGNAQHD